MAIAQYLLQSTTPGCSGRAVRLRELSPTEKDKIAETAAKSVGKEGSMIEYRNEEIRQGLFKMLVGVTKTKGLTKVDDVLALKPEDWFTPTLEQLNMGSYDDLFTPKDDMILSSIYRRQNEISREEIEDIVGKAMPVSEG